MAIARGKWFFRMKLPTPFEVMLFTVRRSQELGRKEVGRLRMFQRFPERHINRTLLCHYSPEIDVNSHPIGLQRRESLFRVRSWGVQYFQGIPGRLRAFSTRVQLVPCSPVSDSYEMYPAMNRRTVIQSLSWEPPLLECLSSQDLEYVLECLLPDSWIN